MDNYLRGMADFVGFAKPKSDLIYFMTKPEVRASIKNLTGGKEYLQLMDMYLEDIPNPTRKGAGDSYEKFINSIAIAPLSLNPTMLPKQISSALNFQTDMIYDQVWRNMPVIAEAQFVGRLMSPVGWAEYTKAFSSSAFTKYRLEKGASDIDYQTFLETKLMPTLSSKSSAAKKANKVFKFLDREVKTGTVKWGDIIAFMGGKPVYEQQVKKIGKENPSMSKQEVSDLAIENMVTMGELKQQSSYSENLSQFQLRSKASMFFKYMSTPIQHQQRVSNATRKLIRGGGTKQENLQSIREIYHYAIVANYVFAQMGKLAGRWIWGTGDDEKEEEVNNHPIVGKAVELLGTGVFQGTPVLGRTLEYYGKKLQSKDTYNVQVSNTARRMQDAFNGTKAYEKLMIDDGKAWDELTKEERERIVKGFSKTLEISGWGVDNVRKMYNRLVYGKVNPTKEDQATTSSKPTKDKQTPLKKSLPSKGGVSKGEIKK